MLFCFKRVCSAFFVDESGKEVTSNFFTEEQAIPIFNDLKQHELSKYSFSCLEDSILVIGELDSEQVMYNNYSQLETITHN